VECVGTTTAAGYAAARPHPALGGLVDSYVGYRVVGPPGVHRGLPSRHVTFVVTIDEPITVTMPGDRRTSLTALVGGLHQAPALITHDGVQHGVQLAVTPAGVRALFGLPAGELTGLVVPLDVLLGPVAAVLAERLAAAPGWPARFAVLDEVLCRALRTSRSGGAEPAPEVGHAWRRLVAADGAASVGGLAAEVGWSRRHLAERFRREIGLPPKVAARVLRFERARAALLAPSPDGPRLADVAAACGYADKAHLSREWRELAGCTPSQWLAEEAPWVHVPFVQDDEGLPAAG
jgi:AraC-like DNA-binding protein